MRVRRPDSADQDPCAQARPWCELGCALRPLAISGLLAPHAVSGLAGSEDLQAVLTLKLASDLLRARPVIPRLGGRAVLVT
jgi:hypothetical protein